tara:strand:+ start:1754 stop:2068 length:315 start_codon:yes stop_codon:yes gene_type:complete
MSEKESILLSDVSITGDIVEKEKISIDSKINGNVKADTISTFENSNIKGDIEANNVKIGGKLLGNVKSDRTRISSTADVEGNLDQSSLSIEDGAALKIKTQTKK